MVAGSTARRGKDCQDINALSNTLAKSRNPAELLDAWRGWHAIAPAMKPKYERFVALGNEGARELGYKDLGAMWRSNYDMPADAFAAELDRLWEQVKPLYDALHAHVRASLVAKYGPKVVPPDGPIPAHLLGNMWAQQWGNIYDLVGVPASGPGYDLSALLTAKQADEKEMVRYGERFFTSLGFGALPQTFWERSLFKKPMDRDVVCHASAWDIDSDQDLRIKMCIQITGEDFVTVHHELGHNIYQRAYRKQPYLYSNSANDGFHEAIGDAIALSVTPDYLVKVGLLGQAPGPDGDLEFLMRTALDRWRSCPSACWSISGAGKCSPAWCRRSATTRRGGSCVESIRTSRLRSHAAKPTSTQAPSTTCRPTRPTPAISSRTSCSSSSIARCAGKPGYTGPLHRCSIYGNKEVGKKLAAMLEMGQSRAWPDALEALTGERKMDATAILDYFAPLKKWLDAQAEGRKSAAPRSPAPVTSDQ